MKLLINGQTITIGSMRLLSLAKWYHTTPNRHEICPWDYATGGDAFNVQCCFKTCGKLFITAKEKGTCPCKTYPKDYVDCYVKQVLRAAEIAIGKGTTCQLGSERAKRAG